MLIFFAELAYIQSYVVIFLPQQLIIFFFAQDYKLCCLYNNYLCDFSISVFTHYNNIISLTNVVIIIIVMV